MADKCLAKPSLLLMALYSLQFLAFTGRETQQQFSNSKHSRFYWTKKHFISEGYFVCCCSEWYLVCYCFFFLKVREVMCFPLKIKAWVAFGLPYLLIELFYIGMPVVRTHGRCTVTWLPNFLGSVDYHISLAMGLRAARGASPWTCQVLFWKKSAIICILARNIWASVSIIYYPSIKCKYNRPFLYKNLWWLFFIYVSQK